MLKTKRKLLKKTKRKNTNWRKIRNPNKENWSGNRRRMTKGIESQKTHIGQTHVRRQELIFIQLLWCRKTILTVPVCSSQNGLLCCMFLFKQCKTEHYKYLRSITYFTVYDRPWTDVMFVVPQVPQHSGVLPNGELVSVPHLPTAWFFGGGWGEQAGCAFLELYSMTPFSSSPLTEDCGMVGDQTIPTADCTQITCNTTKIQCYREVLASSRNISVALLPLL